MADLVTWSQVGPITKTGSALADFYTDLNELFASKALDETFPWVVASYNDVGTPLYLVLKRRSGAPGRVLIVSWTSNPAGYNSTLFVTSHVSTVGIYITYFPAGTADTPSNLTSSSGTILGDDTDALYLSHYISVSYFYTNYVQASVHADGVLLAAKYGSSTQYYLGAGDLVVDTADTSYACCFSASHNSSVPFCEAIPWTNSIDYGNSDWEVIRSTYIGANTNFFLPWEPSDEWPSSLLYDPGTNKKYFMPLYLASYVKGRFYEIKFRQMAFGDSDLYENTNTPYYDSSLVLPDAIHHNPYAEVTDTGLWLTNFKV